MTKEGRVLEVKGMATLVCSLAGRVHLFKDSCPTVSVEEVGYTK